MARSVGFFRRPDRTAFRPRRLGLFSKTPPSQVTGATVCGVTAHGTLAAKGALAGATGCGTTASGTLAAKGALSGAATCGITSQGALTEAAAGGVTVTPLASGTGLTAGSKTLSVTVPSGTDKLVVCVAGTNGSGTPAVTSLTWNGVALTLAKAQATTLFASEIWYLDAPDSGTHDVVVNWGSSANSCVISVLAVDGAATGAPETTGGTTDTSADTSTSTSVTSATSGAVAIESWGVGYTITGVPASGQTEDYDLSDSAGTGVNGGSAHEVLGAAGAYSQAYTWSSAPSVAVHAVAVWAPGVNVGTLVGATVCPSTSAGVLTAKGALVGASACGAISYATRSARCALSGATSCTTTAAGGLTGKGALTGASAAPITAAATLAGKAALVGATTCTVTAAGYLTGITLRGGTACWVTATGTMTGRGALAGAAACWVSAAGTLGVVSSTFAPIRRGLETGRIRATENGLVVALERGRVRALEGGAS